MQKREKRGPWVAPEPLRPGAESEQRKAEAARNFSEMTPEQRAEVIERLQALLASFEGTPASWLYEQLGPHLTLSEIVLHQN